MAGKVDQQSIEGSSGRSYSFKCYRANDPFKPFPKFPDSSGVYIFADISRIDEYGNDLPKVLYVGESHSFEERVVEEHEKWECALDHKVTHICVLELKDSSKSERLRIEKDIRIEHKPECNKEQS